MTTEPNELPSARTRDIKDLDQKARGRLSLMDTYMGLFVCGTFIILIPTLMLINHLIPRPTGLSYHHRITDGWAVPMLSSLFTNFFLGIPLGLRWLRRRYPSDIDDYLAVEVRLFRFSIRYGTFFKWVHRLAIPVLLLLIPGFGLLTRIENGVSPNGILYRSNAFSSQMEIPFSDVSGIVVYNSWESRFGTIKPGTRIAIHRYSTADRPYLSEFSNHASDFLRAVRKEDDQVPVTKKEVMLWKDR